MNNRLTWKLALMMALTAGTANAALIYSWTGNIFPRGGPDDPWGVGSGTPFEISLSVRPGALDRDASVSLAEFQGDDVEVTYSVGGIAASVVPGQSPRALQFLDDSNSDYIIIDFSAELFDSEQRILTVAVMSRFTFTYDEALENPPVFASTLTTNIPTSSAGIYWSTTPRQTPVIVSDRQSAAEPPVAALLLVPLAVLAFARRRKEKREKRGQILLIRLPHGKSS